MLISKPNLAALADIGMEGLQVHGSPGRVKQARFWLHDNT